MDDLITYPVDFARLAITSFIRFSSQLYKAKTFFKVSPIKEL